MAFKLSRPQRRHRVYCTKDSPFPVPIASQTNLPPSENRWNYYTAYMVGSAILVKHSGDMEQLYRMGFFGKGTLSRHRPQLSTTQRTVTWPTSRGSKHLKLMSRRRYLHHVALRDRQTSKQEIDQLPVAKRQPATIEGARVTQSTDGNHEEQAVSKGRTDNDPDTDLSIQPDPQLGHDPWSDNLPKGGHDPWSDNLPKGSHDPWSDNLPKAGHDPGSDNLPQPATSNSIQGLETPDTNTNLNPLNRNSSKGNETSEKTGKNSKAGLIAPHTDPNKEISVCAGDIVPDNITSNLVEETPQINKEHHDMSISDDGDDNDTIVPLDQRCQTADDDGDMLVIDDTDDSEIDETSDTRMTWEPVVKSDPYPVQEKLQLSPEEAFFLAYGLGCLVLYDDNQSPMDLMTMWQRFTTQDSRFLERYIVYHNFRAKGWVPKSGLKNGTDMVVYKHGPAFYHSTYSVVVQRVRHTDLTHVQTDRHRHISWTSLAALNRVTEQVSKDLMLCYVIQPDNLTETELNTPACIAKFSVQEVVLKRSASKQERENPEYVLIP